MAKIIFKESNQEVELKDNSNIKESCEKAGVLFGCEDGYCGTCRIQIGAGEENLGEKNRNETSITGTTKKLRLACQCKISSGIVEINNY